MIICHRDKKSSEQLRLWYCYAANKDTMKRTLLIVANPRRNSFSFAMAEQYKKLALAKGNEVDIIDLYREKYQQSFLVFEDATRREVTPAMKYYQQKITNAGELVFIFPYWWGSFPAILKNFIDWNFSRGFAFHYVNSKPEGLLKGKEVKIFATCGAPSFYYRITGAHSRLKNMFKKQIVKFCGMQLTTFMLFGGVDTHAKNTERILQKIKA